MRKSSGARKRSAEVTERPKKVARTFRLTPGRVEAAQRILGSATATDAIETALEMVVFRRELVEGTKTAFGIKLVPPDHEDR